MSNRLSVLLDATLWDEPTTGIGQYARCLAAALPGAGVEPVRVGAAHSGEVPRGRLTGRSAFVLGELPQLLRTREEPLFHGVGNFNLPLARVPGRALVLTVHDLIPLLLPDTVSVPFRLQFRIWLERSLAVADRVICVSETTRRDLGRLYPHASVPVTVVPHGADHFPDRAVDPEARAWAASQARQERFFLYAGSLDARKNVGLLLDAWERLWHEGKRSALVLVGQRWFGSGPLEARVARMQAEGLEVHPLGHVSAPRLHALMARATAFVFPSRYEGFGLPPLEAMRLGAPAIVSTGGALPEVCGDAAVQVSPDDPEALARAMAALLASPEERRWRVEAGRRWAARFTWARAAELTAAVYRDAVGARG